ncbi:MAG: acetyl-CoA carboxylase, biotin carboxyl carrier protein [Candidatus Eremiobacteraeota bacterium]|nr:acetyl-CoA carboxylase, biotin carboxyl carrier protein [Candidatus Eremiobacteraeota bacterium]
MTESEALRAMLAVMQAHDLDALRLRVGTSTYELVLRADGVAAVSAPVGERRTLPAGLSPSSQIAAANVKKVTAPIIGVFYRASAPGAETFAEVGDRVEVGQVLCILEAMKLMNEITSDFSGIVRRILPDNGALVSLGEEMFWIEP